MGLQEERETSVNRFCINNGSVTVDAAISLPIFVLSFALIFSLIFQAKSEDDLYKKLASEANAGFAIVGAMDVDVPYLVVFGKTEKNDVRKTLYYRPFVGESKESKDANTTVYVYPNAGIRYHIRNCSTLDNNKNYEKMTKKQAVEKGYTACLLCCSDGPDYFKKRRPFSGLPC